MSMLYSSSPDRSHPGTFLMSLVALFTAGSISASAATAITASSPQPLAASVASAQIFGLPMQFEKNAGQTDSQVEFLARGPGYTLFLTPTQAVFSLRAVKRSTAEKKRPGRHERRLPGRDAVTL